MIETAIVLAGGAVGTAAAWLHTRRATRDAAGPEAVRHDAAMAAIMTRGWRGEVTADVLYQVGMHRVVQPGQAIEYPEPVQPTEDWDRPTITVSVQPHPARQAITAGQCGGHLTIHRDQTVTCHGGRDNCTGNQGYHHNDVVACNELSHGCGQCATANGYLPGHGD